MKTLISLISLFLSTTVLSAQDIHINSSNKDLEKSFEWAKTKARSFVVTGQTGPVNRSEQDKPYITRAYQPVYWAGYPLRTAFYSRDFCHQISGAHLLGLDVENFTMMKSFAASANFSRKWYPLWAINFDGTPFNLDYRGDDNFVREVPATFELVEKAYKLYCWTADKRYLDDPVLWNYYTKAVTDFITLHDTKIPNGVAEGTGEGNIFKGTATYNEQADTPLFEAGDGIATQYAAFVAFSEMAQLRGEKQLSKFFSKKASSLKNYFNTEWGIKGTTTYNRGYSTNQKAVSGWGKENSWFMPMKGIVDESSERTKNYLDFISERLDSKEDIPDNIEAISYVPEVFFQYSRNEEGWKWMKHILTTINNSHVAGDLTDKNGNYPEVSYVLISNTIENLAGVEPKAFENKVSTASLLPKDIEMLEIKNIRMGESLFSIQHNGLESSILKYESGRSPLKWEVGFIGTHRHLLVNGERHSGRQIKKYGVTYTVCLLNLEPGEQIKVSIK